MKSAVGLIYTAETEQLKKWKMDKQYNYLWGGFSEFANLNMGLQTS